jgi:hypothetical protein
MVATKTSQNSARCHGLVPWSFTLDALVNRVTFGSSAANVNLHGARPWHPEVFLTFF